MRSSRTILIFLMILQLLVVAPSSSGQRLYDKRRDEQAQDAKKYIETLLDGAVFDAQLTNLALLSKQDLEALLLGAKYETRSTVNRFIEWRDVNCFVIKVKATAQAKEDEITRGQQLSDDQRRRLIKEVRDKLIKDLKEQIKNASAELTKLKNEAACKKDPQKNFAKCLTPEQAAACEQKPDPKPKECVEPDASDVESFFAGVGELEELEKQVKSLESKAVSPSVIKAGEKIKDVLDKLEVVFKNYRERMVQYNQLEAQLMEFRIALKQVAIQALQVEAEHLNNIAEIQARRELQEAEIEDLIKEYEGLAGPLRLGYHAKCSCPTRKTEDIGCPDTLDDNIEMTLRDAVNEARNAEAALAEAEKASPAARTALENAEARARAELDRLRAAVRGATGARAHNSALRQVLAAELTFRQQQLALQTTLREANEQRRVTRQRVIDSRDSLADRIQALYIATSLASYGELPSRLANQRIRQEEHAYSIRLSRVRARAYQLTVSTGVQRLALYHQGGIKPSLVARLIQAASTVAIPPILAAK